MEYNLPKKENNALKEPDSVYEVPAKKKLRIFNSFLEQEQEMINYWASITPQKRLEHLYEMIKISYRIIEQQARQVVHPRKLTIIKGNPCISLLKSTKN